MQPASMGATSMFSCWKYNFTFSLHHTLRGDCYVGDTSLDTVTWLFVGMHGYTFVCTCMHVWVHTLALVMLVHVLHGHVMIVLFVHVLHTLWLVNAYTFLHAHTTVLCTFNVHDCLVHVLGTCVHMYKCACVPFGACSLHSVVYTCTCACALHV